MGRSWIQDETIGTSGRCKSTIWTPLLCGTTPAPCDSKSRIPLESESVKCRFSKCRFSVLNLKFDFISDGGCTREEQIQKALGSLPPCGNRCRFSESAICSSRVRPPSEIKSNFKFKTLRWRPLRWRLTLPDRMPTQQEMTPRPSFLMCSSTALPARVAFILVVTTFVGCSAYVRPKLSTTCWICGFQFEPQRAQIAKKLLCAVGFPPIPERSPKSAQIVHKQEYYCAKTCKSAVLRTFRRSFWNRRKTHLMHRFIFLLRFGLCGLI